MCPWAKNGDVSLDGAHLFDHSVGPTADLLHRLAREHPVAPECPARPLLADVERRPAPVLAVVPLPELVADGTVEASQDVSATPSSPNTYLPEDVLQALNHLRDAEAAH
jgi:hypothetical protein